jgi:uncharacterized protein (DUF2147 family)
LYCLNIYPMRYLSIFLLIVLCSFKAVTTDDTPKANQICGKWMSAKKDIIVEVYPYKNTFKARIVWFNGGVTKEKPMESITDIKNPDKNLRNRKVLGLPVVENLTYDPKSNSWEGGKIYEVQSGKYWNAAATLENNNLLKVKGYWHVKMLGKTLTFTRV